MLYPLGSCANVKGCVVRTFIGFETRRPKMVEAALSVVFPGSIPPDDIERFLQAISTNANGELTHLGVTLAKKCGDTVSFTEQDESCLLTQPAPQTVVDISSERPDAWNVILRIDDKAGEIVTNILLAMADVTSDGMVIDFNCKDMSIIEALQIIAPNMAAA